jgi:hypothetical protein
MGISLFGVMLGFYSHFDQAAFKGGHWQQVLAADAVGARAQGVFMDEIAAHAHQVGFFGITS